MKQRQMQMKAGAKSRRGGNTPGPARNYSIKELLEKERALVLQAGVLVPDVQKVTVRNLSVLRFSVCYRKPPTVGGRVQLGVLRYDVGAGFWQRLDKVRVFCWRHFPLLTLRRADGARNIAEIRARSIISGRTLYKMCLL